jgi:hypothetical protein
MLSVNVTVNSNGDFSETIFELPDGRAIVTTNSPGDWAGLFRSRADWEQANTPDDAEREYDSVAEAFADVI